MGRRGGPMEKETVNIEIPDMQLEEYLLTHYVRYPVLPAIDLRLIWL